MAKVVAVTNMKGGTAKTSTAVNLADMLASKGERVLLIDASPQANATGYISVQKLDQEKTTYELLCGDLSAEECVLKNVLPNLSCIPANIDLAAANPELGIVDEIDILQRKIDLIRDDYDHIIIDCSGELARYTLCALYAADHYLIPIASDHLAYQSYREFLTVLEKAGGKLWEGSRIMRC